jgi:hypothetical protein
MARQKYIAVGNRWVPANEAAVERAAGPMIQGAPKPFVSMVDGKLVTSLAKYRADLRAHGYEEVGDQVEYMKPRAPSHDPELKELIAAQFRELGYDGMKKALRRDIEFIRNNSRNLPKGD